MAERPRVTIVEGDDSVAKALNEILQMGEFRTRRLTHEALSHPLQDTFSEDGEVVLFDLFYPFIANSEFLKQQFQDFQVLSERLRHENLVLIPMTTIPNNILVNLIDSSWQEYEDFIPKPFDLNSLLDSIQQKHPSRRIE